MKITLCQVAENNITMAQHNQLMYSGFSESGHNTWLHRTDKGDAYITLNSRHEWWVQTITDQDFFLDFEDLNSAILKVIE